MENQLSLINNQINLEALNHATGFKSFMYPQKIRLNGDDGHFYISTNEKNENNKKIFKDLGLSIKIHFILTRKQITGSWNNAMEKFYQYYSQEFIDNFLILFDENKTPVFKGFYRELKENPNFAEKIIFNNIIYCFLNDELCRLTLSGSKLGPLFEYQNMFENDNPAKYLTEIFSVQGQSVLTIKRKKYFVPLFKKGEAIKDNQLIINRVNFVNEYLGAYYNANHKEENETINVIPLLNNYSQFQKEKEEEINIDNIPCFN